MDISSVSGSLVQQINNNATQTGDAVSIAMMRKALDIQAAQASQLIQSAAQSMPDPGARLGQNVDIRV